MKLRQEGRKGRGMKSIEMLQPEQVAERGFDPERDIPPEVKTELFKELDAFVRRRMWLEYIVLYNKLELLFPQMEGREKEALDLGELTDRWTRAHESEREPHTVTLHSINISSSYFPHEAMVAAELRRFGVPIETFLTPQRLASFQDLCDREYASGSARFQLNALTLVRLGARKADDVFDHKNFAWLKLERSFKENEVRYIVESMAAAKVLFPEKTIEVDPEVQAKLLHQAKEEMDRFGPTAAATEYANLLLATAEEVHVGERGELLVRKSTSGRMNTAPDLPERPVH